MASPRITWRTIHPDQCSTVSTPSVSPHLLQLHRKLNLRWGFLSALLWLLLTYCQHKLLPITQHVITVCLCSGNRIEQKLVCYEAKASALNVAIPIGLAHRVRLKLPPQGSKKPIHSFYYAVVLSVHKVSLQCRFSFQLKTMLARAHTVTVGVKKKSMWYCLPVQARVWAVMQFMDYLLLYGQWEIIAHIPGEVHCSFSYHTDYRELCNKRGTQLGLLPVNQTNLI